MKQDAERCSTHAAARDRPRGAASLRVLWDTDYSADVVDNRRWKGRRLIKNASDVA